MFSFFATKQSKHADNHEPAIVDFGTIENLESSASRKEAEKKGIFNWIFEIGRSTRKVEIESNAIEPLLTDVNSKVLKMKSIEINDSEFIDVGNGKLSYAEVALFKVSKEAVDQTSNLKSANDGVVIIDQDLDLGKAVTDMEMIEEYKKHKQFDASVLFQAPPPEDEWDDYVESKVPIKMRKKKNLKKAKTLA